MSSSQLSLSRFTTFKEAHEALYNEAVSICTQIKDKIEIVATTGGIALRLYNKNKRPTVYSTTLHTDKYGHICKVEIDTIVAENSPEHDSLKTSFHAEHASHIINILVRLSEQKCNGSKKKTLEVYTPMGLLYWKSPNPIED
jgi:hypothetical protein